MNLIFFHFIIYAFLFTNNQGNIVKLKPDLLPEKVPHLNQIEDYVVGNGMVCAAGNGYGSINFLAGPCYTSPKLLKSETLSLILNNKEIPIEIEMFRARETGLFYGKMENDSFCITLVDFAPQNIPEFKRLILFENLSENDFSVSVKANVEPHVGSGRKDTTLFGNKQSHYLSFCVDTSVYCMYGDKSKWVKNWKTRNLFIRWNQTKSIVKQTNNVYSVISKSTKIRPKAFEVYELNHECSFANEPDKSFFKNKTNENMLSSLNQNINHWQSWYRQVPNEYQLKRIEDTRARDIVEGGLYIIKTNQSKEGGIVANEKFYNLSWTRDAYCGLRGLLATGHFEESKRFILFIKDAYEQYKIIPNANTCGKHTFALYNGNQENNPNRNLGQHSPCPEANTAPETTALYILLARDYFHLTHDTATILSVYNALRYSMDIQLKHAIKNNYHLEFSGDETELCGAVKTFEAGFDRHLNKYWSMSSLALCSASLDFYIEYLKIKRVSLVNYYNELDSSTIDLNQELLKINKSLHENYWRTDLDQHKEGFYEWCRIKDGNKFPPKRIVNFSLFPVYYKLNNKESEKFKHTVNSIYSYYDSSTQTLPLISDSENRAYLGHNLGYLLWGLTEINDSRKEIIYNALIKGNSVQCWGSFNEAYKENGIPNKNNLRTFETGVNIDAIAKYWKIGNFK